MWPRISIFLFVQFVNDYNPVTANDPEIVNDLIDSFLKDRLNKLGDKIDVGNITFHGLTLEDTELKGVQGFKRCDDFSAWDWYSDEGWSEVYGDLKADYLLFRSRKLTTHTPKSTSHSEWIKITNVTVHVHYEAKFMDYPYCELEKELLTWKWIDELFETSEGSYRVSEDEVNKFKRELDCKKSIQKYFRLLFMYKCLQNYEQQPSAYYFPVRDYPD